MATKTKTDNRPRFGWTTDLDNDPQYINEERPKGRTRGLGTIPVAVIPLPIMSAKQRAKVRWFVKEYVWPKE